MKKLNIFLVLVLLVMSFCSTNVFAGYQEMNDLQYEAQINPDGSVDVTEFWDISISETNTLFKTFVIDSSKYSKITNISVSEIKDGQEIKYTDVGEWQNHVEQNGYYGEFYNGMFEIGWYAGYGNRAGRKEYKISYTIEDALRRGADYAEFYWQFIGKDNGIHVDIITGTIYLPANATSKESIKVWGHTPALNGTIHATGLNKVEFDGANLEVGNMFEVRVLFPASMTNDNLAKYVKANILDEVVKEETKWANAANARRFIENVLVIVLPAILAVVSFVIFVITSIKAILAAIKVRKIALEKYSPTQKLDYYREFPSEDATPAEALAFLLNEVRDIKNSDFGNIFSANILNLNLKGAIKFEVDTSKSRKEEMKIVVMRDNGVDLNEDEIATIRFLKKIEVKYKEITPKTIQKYMKKNYEKAFDLKDDIELNTYKLFRQKSMYDGDIEERKDLQNGCLYFTSLISGIVFISMFSELYEPITTNAVMFMIVLIIIERIFNKRAEKCFSILTKKGIDEQEKWRAFKRYMEEYSLLHERDVQEVALWEKYLVYATAFGTAKKVLKRLKVSLPEVYNNMSNATSSNLYIINSDFSSYCNSGFKGAASAKSAAEAAAASSYSSGSGGGGGFSGGGGGRRWPEAAWEVVNTLKDGGSYSG